MESPPPCCRSRQQVDSLAQKLALVESENARLRQQLESYQETARVHENRIEAVQAKTYLQTHLLACDTARLDQVVRLIKEQEATIDSLSRQVNQLQRKIADQTSVKEVVPPLRLGKHLETLLAKSWSS
ncbi:hypothetical protein Ae201684P_011333 [Aphanomyces euteiches]|nr:hypothetical protein Ae201684P_011333 [Aphanomyces euteiches]KAH9136101.1 hypothetical protein AeRB84_018643 [Aphanomyces euteiches]